VSITDIKQIPIIDIAARLGIELNRYGKALCFKGHDTTPSLSVSVRGNFFKCFGCNIGGSGIDLVKEYLNIPTAEAIRWIESKYSICRGTPGGPNADKTPHRANGEARGTIKQDGRKYADIYREFLDLLDTDEAVKYLEGRGIRRDITERAEIKAVPKDHAGIKKALADKQGIDRLKAAGIVAESKTSGKLYFVFFNHRLIIPYHDADGNIVNLQGRNIIDTGGRGEYRLLSDIDTVLYNLRGLRDIRPGGTVYLCEGAIDALSCLQLGLEHPIAVAGVNNFKAEYFDVLEPYRLIIASDKDGAGNAFYLRLKKGYLRRGKGVHALDYSLLKADYNVTGAVKDLNDIAKQADYSIHDKRQVFCHWRAGNVPSSECVKPCMTFEKRRTTSQCRHFAEQWASIGMSCAEINDPGATSCVAKNC
jgi:DNA primase